MALGLLSFLLALFCSVFFRRLLLGILKPERNLADQENIGYDKRYCYNH